MTDCLTLRVKSGGLLTVGLQICKLDLPDERFGLSEALKQVIDEMEPLTDSNALTLPQAQVWFREKVSDYIQTRISN